MKIGQFLGEEEPILCQMFGGLPDFELPRKSTALLLVDMVNGDAAPGLGGFWHLAEERGLASNFNYYTERLSRMVIPNLQRLVEAFRAENMEVIHGVTHGYTKDGRDRKRPSKKEAQAWVDTTTRPWWNQTQDGEIIKELEPRPNEIIIAKTAPGFFGVTVIDKVLTNLGIETLVVGGVVTHQCVESTVRGASDYGFNVVLVDDSCATLSEDLHKASLRALGDWYCKVRTTDDVYEEIMSL